MTDNWNTLENIVNEYAFDAGWTEVWRSWKDTMLEQDREVKERFLDLPIPEQDVELDSQIAYDVVMDFLLWARAHKNIGLVQDA